MTGIEYRVKASVPRNEVQRFTRTWQVYRSTLALLYLYWKCPQFRNGDVSCCSNVDHAFCVVLGAVPLTTTGASSHALRVAVFKRGVEYPSAFIQVLERRVQAVTLVGCKAA
jgi:hypothetical protein